MSTTCLLTWCRDRIHVYLLIFSDDGWNISSSLWDKFSSSRHGSNTCRFCFIWWYSCVSSLFTLIFIVTYSILNVSWCIYFLICEASQFAPRLKGVLTRVLPILGNVKDIHRPIFANGMLTLLHLCYEVACDFFLLALQYFIECQESQGCFASSLTILLLKAQTGIAKMMGFDDNVGRWW